VSSPSSSPGPAAAADPSDPLGAADGSAERSSSPAPRIELEAFREAFAEVPMPVAVVTATAEGGRPVGTTVSSFCSLSADPPLVLAALDADSNTLPVVTAAGRFGVNVLAHHQEHVARTCATKASEKANLMAPGSDLEAPRIEEAAVWLNCSVVEIRPVGDHHILIGMIEHAEVARKHPPLLYHRRSFAAVSAGDGGRA
jgi:flavin reductase (DIM6/NTAB) family NADH-FMN oxidoreductase RutF